MKRVALSIGCFLLAVNAPFLQTKSPIEGVWKITEVRWSRAQPAARQGAVVSSPQPGLMIFTRGYYRTVEVRDGGQQPRAAAAARVRLRNATPSVFHQHHIGRVLRPS